MENLSRKEQEQQLREKIMVQAAQKLFAQKGFDNVTMNEIADEAEFTKRTLYRYFTNKQDLFFAVALDGFKQMFKYCKEGFESGQNGFAKISNGLRSYLEFAENNTATFRIINAVGHLRRKTKNSPKMEEWLQFDDQLFQSVAKVIQEGQQDGSIRKDLDPLKGTFSIIFMSTGFFRLLTETGANYADHFNLDLDNFSRYTLQLLLDSIKARKEQ